MLEEELIALFPAVYRANAMAKELKRNVNFEIVLVSPEARGLEDGLTEVMGECMKMFNPSYRFGSVSTTWPMIQRFYGKRHAL